MNNTIIVSRIYLFAVSAIYIVAFLSISNDWKGLLGSNGLTPIQPYVETLRKDPNLSYQHPTLFLYIQPTDYNLNLMIQIGLITAIITTVVPNFIFYIILWILYTSIVNVGQTWYSFGWESQLLEVGFLAIWLAPYQDKIIHSSFVVKLANVSLIFRIMLGAGLIKIRGDQCWRNLTCMNYFYETQPVPNPLSWYFHMSPNIFHGFEVLINHFVELFAPLMLIFPNRKIRIYGALIQIAFQLLIILSGNLSFLNWLTIIPCIFCFDDKCFNFQSQKQVFDEYPKQQQQQQQKCKTALKILKECSLAILLGYLSINPIQNLFSSKQIMNTSFDRFRIVNTYGAFGSVGKERTEITIFGAYNEGEWQEYTFKCKPGPIDRTPCQISPYHYRLDWLAWFAGFQNYQYQPWTLHLLYKLMDNDKDALQLIEYNPFQNQKPPQKMKIDSYLYKFSTKPGQYWDRTYLGEWCPPVRKEQIYPILQQMQWIVHHA